MKKIILLVLIMLFPINVQAISAHSSIAMDLNSGRILHANNIDDKHLIASITKIMTCIIAIEYGDLNEEIVVGEEVLKAYGSSIYIEVGEKLTLKDLLMGLMLRSGNDAAIVIANHIGQNMDGFALLMNEKAISIGMKNTYFYNAHGLEESNGKGNISTARDMALLTKYAMNNIYFREIFGTKKYTLKTNYKSYSWVSKNKLIHSNDFITGGKTGYTKKAHRTLVTTGSKNGIDLVIVTLDDSNDFQDHLNLYQDIFKKYELLRVTDKNNIKIKKDTIYSGYRLYTKNDITLPILPSERSKVRVDYKLYDNIKYVDGDIIGYIEVYLNDNMMINEKIYIKVPQKNNKKNWWKKLFGWLRW